MKKLILLLAEGFEEIEALTVVDVLRRGGVVCDICSLKGEFVKGSHGITVQCDVTLDNAELRKYDGLILPGGMPGSENLRNNVRVVELVKDFFKSGKLTSAICAAPIVLAEAGITDGRRITSYPDFKEKLGNCIYCEEAVIVDDNLITSRGPATALLFSLELLKHLGFTQEAEALRESMLVNLYESTGERQE
jgi:protein deglycase